MSSLKTILFTDLRHIQCGHLGWFTLEGERRPVSNPPLPVIEAYSAPQMIPYGIRLVAQKCEKSEPFPRGTPVWLNRLMFEEGTYRSWTLKANYSPGKDFGAYSTTEPFSVEIKCSESQDGFEWKEVASSTIDVAGQTGFDGFAVFKDLNASDRERYKAVWMAHPPKSEEMAFWEAYQKVHPRYRDPRINQNNVTLIYGAVSPDGLQWERIREPLMCHYTDTLTSLYYDTWLGRYVMYTRLYKEERRWVGRAEGEEFTRWEAVEPLLWPGLDDPFSYDIYTNGRTEYPDLPQYHLMFPMFYRRGDESSKVRLFSSADGICWNKVPGDAVISPSTPGKWDGEFIAAGNGLVPLPNNRVGLLYAGTRFPHKYPRWTEVLEAGQVAWASWEKGRLCAIIADEQGEFFTFVMVPAGREMKLNARVRRGGEVRVELIKAAGQTIVGRTLTDCDPVFGDSLAHRVHWKRQSDIGVNEGEPVMIHFKLRSAEVYGFEWV